MGPEPVEGHPTPGMHLWGWMSPSELEWLGKTAAEMNSVVEIGCLHGRSSFALATACKGHVYCIDPWNDPGYESWMGSVGSVFPNVTGIREASPGAASLVPDVDMVFIDGAHDYDSVIADIRAWLPKTRVLICGHDYIPEEGAGFPDVAVAVNEVFGVENVVLAPDTAIWTVWI